VADEQDGTAAGRHLRHAVEAARLELRIAYRQHLVDHEDLGFEVRRNGEGETGIHADRIALHRRVDELAHAREVDDLLEAVAHFGPRHAENRAIQEDVLAARQLGMEAGADFQQAGDAPADLDPARGRLGDARQDLEQGGLAGAVVADDADQLASLDLEIDVTQRPYFLRAVSFDDEPAAHQVATLAPEVAGAPHHGLAEHRIARVTMANDELLAQIFGTNDRIGHQTRSAKSRSMRRKPEMPTHSTRAMAPRLIRKPGQ
jgi:hypothetical protein